MKHYKYSTANQLWNAGATEVQRLNPGGKVEEHESQLPGGINLDESALNAEQKE